MFKNGFIMASGAFLGFCGVGLFYPSKSCAAELRPMPAAFCRELKGLAPHSLAYRDTLDACKWDWRNPRKGDKR